MGTDNTHQYDDIIHLPHHVSKKHPQMSMEKRAAQFSPFAALRGHAEAVHEVERLTLERPELDEDQKQQIDYQLQILRADMSHAVEIVYFKPDLHKAGGDYYTVTGYVKKIDKYKKSVILQNGEQILIDGIVQINLL